ncbi:ester cyclase [Micromonospora sp. NPDC052213]|uniref:ester cyclase n=1 Tax=Micromonospora sp. NPDC052213 TaxID=3155812 RepID=UPI0034258356
MHSDPVAVVRSFLEVVRSGVDPSQAGRFMAPTVTARQVQAEAPAVVERSPQQYAEHVTEMLDAYGRFTLTVDELFGSGEKVYARWTQRGHHVGEVDGLAPTGAPVTQVTSAVYRVVDGLIVEYWIQIDRYGLRAQLER